MHNKKVIKYILVILMFIVLFSLQIDIFGDTGNNVDYSTGSSGYDSYDYGDSSSSGDSGIIELLFYLIFSSLPFPIKVIVFMGIVIFYIYLKKSGKTINKSRTNARPQNMSQSIRVADNTSEIERAIVEQDNNFSTGKFLGWSEEVFMTLQHAWTARDWDNIRPFEKEELYRKHQLQLQEYINNGTINVVERININQSYLYEYERDREYEYLTVYLQVRLNDYIIDENTRKVVSGDKHKEHHMMYLLTFMRKTGVLTDEAKSNMSTKQCPHCGAPLAITSAGKCEYCDTIVTTGEFDWVLSDLDSVKPHTNIGRGGVRIR